MKRGGPLRRLTPLRSTSAVLRRTPLAPVSAKRRAEATRRRAAVAAAAQRDGGCVARHAVVAVGCAGPLDGHERKSRARGGDPLDPDHIIILCRAHHDFSHAHPVEAHRLGFLVHSWEEF